MSAQLRVSGLAVAGASAEPPSSTFRPTSRATTFPEPTAEPAPQADSAVAPAVVEGEPAS